MRFTLPVLVAVLLPTLSACVGAMTVPAPLVAGAAEFDVNRNDVIEPEEAGPQLRLLFGRFDTDRNGVLTNAELLAYFAWRGSEATAQAERTRNAVPPAAGDATAAALLDAYLAYGVDTLGWPGAALMVGRQDKSLYTGSAGAYRPDTILPVASGSKWVAAAMLIAAVDRGLVSLDAPLSHYLPEIATGWRDVTLRQMFSHSAGAVPGHATRYDPRWPFAPSADEILSQELADAPGATFSYGGLSMQIGAYVIERQAGRTWNALYRDWIADPLGMGETVFGHATWHADGVEILTPNIAGGLRISAADYLRFVEMLAASGRYRGRQILSTHAIDALFVDRTRQLIQRQRPAGTRSGWSYALGAWCEAAADGSCTVLNSAGAYGSSPGSTAEREPMVCS